MTKPSVLLSRRWPATVERAMAERFDLTVNETDRPLSPADFRAAFARFDAVCPTVSDRLGPEVFDLPAARTRILGNYGVGVSHIDLDAARRLQISVSNTPDVLSDCTADLAMTLLLMIARRVGEGERQLRSGGWTGWHPTHLIGTRVSGATLGIIGFGRIGQAMAQRAHFGFGMRILVQNRSKLPEETLIRYGATQIDTVDALLPQCDFVSLHCPGGAANRHLIDSRRLDLMRPGAFLVNTARGELVDEHALAQALWFGTIGGAALDVYDREPAIPDALLGADNLVMLPHLGSATDRTREAMGLRVMDNLSAFFDGRRLPDRVI
jgi:glyoxylate reductase